MDSIALTNRPSIEETRPRSDASVLRGFVRFVGLQLGVVGCLFAPLLSAFIAANGLPSLVFIQSAAQAYLVLSVGIIFLSTPLYLLMWWRMRMQLLPRTIRIVDGQANLSWPKEVDEWAVSDCTWAIGRTTSEWLGLFLPSKPAILLIRPNGRVFSLGSDRVTVERYADLLGGWGACQVDFVPMWKSVARSVGWLMAGGFFGYLIGASLGTLVGFAIGVPLDAVGGTLGMLVGAPWAIVRVAKLLNDPPTVSHRT